MTWQRQTTVKFKEQPRWVLKKTQHQSLNGPIFECHLNTGLNYPKFKYSNDVNG